MHDIPATTLDYEPAAADAGRTFFRRARVVTVPAVFAGVWYIAVSFRTTDAGGSRVGRLFLCGFVGVLFGIVPAAAAWLGLPARRYLLAILLTALAPALLAEGYATVEEQVFLAQCRRLPPSRPVIYQNRWWPSGDHDLWYDPATGEFGGGD